MAAIGGVPGAPTDMRAAMRTLQRKNAFAEPENTDPMSSVSNIADVFLVLMVGFLIAFITISGIPLTDLMKIDSEDLTEIDSPEVISEEVMASGSGYEKMEGQVYKDPETGTIYILEEPAGDE